MSIRSKAHRRQRYRTGYRRGPHETLSMDRVLAVGFGDVQVTKNGEQIYSEMSTSEGKDDVPAQEHGYWNR